jgi:hypothetical protein
MAGKSADSELVKLNLRMQERLRALVEADAESRGLSMNAAIIQRLERTFREDQAVVEREQAIRSATEAELKQRFGGERAFEDGLVWASTVAALERVAGKSWRADLETNLRVRSFLDAYVAVYGPTGAISSARDVFRQGDAIRQLGEFYGMLTPERWAAEEKWIAEREAAAGKKE